MGENEPAAIQPENSAPLPHVEIQTFLFTDIEGSTELWERYEDAMRRAMVQHDALIEEIVATHHGHVVKPRGEGDSRFIVFTQAVQALAAALAIQLKMQNEPWPTPAPLRVRIGLHSGEARMEQGDYYGDTINRCARIRSLGHGGQTLLSARTAALAEDRLPQGATLEDMGQHRLKGISKPEQIFQLHAPGLMASFPPLRSLPAAIEVQPPAFLEATTETEPTRDAIFVGRESELEQLDGFLEQALAGQGRVAFAVGDAGRGKTALVRSFSQAAQKRYPQLVVAWGNCNAYTGVGDPYLPFREVIALLTGDAESRWAAGAINTAQAQRLWQLAPGTAQILLSDGPDLVDVFLPGTALIARMQAAGAQATGWLSRLEALVDSHSAGKGQAVQQLDLLEQYTRVLQLLTGEAPLLLIVDDLQWADNASIHLLTHLGRRIAGSRILVVGIYRPEEVAMGRAGERHPLEKAVNEFQRDFGDVFVDLRRAEGRLFIDAYLDSEPNRLGEDFRQALFQHTRGHALFTAEIVSGLRERGDLVRDEEGRWTEGPTLNWEILPPRIEGVIGERIGRLPEALQDALKIGAVEGETFTAEVIAHLNGVEEREMVRQLSSRLDRQYALVRGQDSQRRGAQRLSRYRFRHILFQRYLYDSLDDIELPYLHEAVGAQLERLYGLRAGEIAAELALHFEKAGLQSKAADYFYQAGSNAVKLTANEEAIEHFRRGLSLLEPPPETDERDRLELKLQIALFAPLAGTKGYGAPEVGHAYRRARELCERIDDPHQLFLVLYGLWGHNLVRSELEKARALAAECLELAERMGRVDYLMEAHRMTDETAFYLGEFGRARQHFETSYALYDPAAHRDHAEVYGQEPGVALLSHGCCILWQAGNVDRALLRSREAVTLAEKQEHPFSLGFALCYSAMMQQYRGDVAAVLTLTEQAIELSRRQGFVIWEAQASFFQGWALAEQGQLLEGIAQMESSLSAWLDAGIHFLMAYAIALLAEATAKAGQVEEALALLEKALAAVSGKNQGFYEAEILRLQGALFWRQGSAAERVESLFKQAVEVAQRRQAVSQELRAVTSLAHFWIEQGKTAAAREALSAAYSRFEEGFETAPLREAAELLQELAAGS